MVKKYYDEAANSALQIAYTKVLDDNKELEIVAQPIVDIKDINDEFVEFSFILTAKPEIKLGKYKGLKVERDSTEVTEEEIKNAMDEMLNRYAELVSKDGKVAINDTAIIDF